MDGAVAGDELETGDLGGEGRPAASGAVRPRDEGTCDGLPVEVAHVVQREPESFEGGVEQVKRGAAQDGHTVIATRSTSTTPTSRSGRSSHPSVTATSVKEWPAPTIFSRTP